MMGAAALLCVASLLEAAAGSYVMTDYSIRTAVNYWLSDSAAAEAEYGHISAWETGGVTDMSYLFCAYSGNSDCNSAAASFNEDIGAWDTSGVTRMYGMFWGASSFNQNIGGWNVANVRNMHYMFHDASAFDQDIGAWDTSGVTTMYGMFHDASAFDQDLGWCVDDDVNLGGAFDNTPCKWTSCGVLNTAALACDGAMTDSTIRTAVEAWLTNSAAAEAMYGHISTWETSGVTDMAYLFCASSDSGYSHLGCNRAARSFNEDISAWDTSGVTNMRWMFYYASAFDQALGWCVDDGVDLGSAFWYTRCGATACGVLQGICDYPMTDSNIRTAVAAWLSDSAAAEATYGHISTWETSGVTDMSYLFCGRSGHYRCNSAAASFNEDIGAWDVSGVTSMEGMFHDASAFDQDLGWCVNGDEVDLTMAFYGTPCGGNWWTSCGVKTAYMHHGTGCSFLGNIMTASNIREATSDWCYRRRYAEATYGHISTWETGEVTDMSYLFTAAASFNDDISAWDTSGVTAMESMFEDAEAFNQDISGWRVGKVKNMAFMFYNAYAFNQPIGGWSIEAVKTMRSMFEGAYPAFDQDLGWCVDDVNMNWAFAETSCDSNACGVGQNDAIGICEPWFRPCLIAGGPSQCIMSSPTLIIAIVLIFLAGFGACVCCRKKKDETCAAAARRVLCGCLCCCCFCCRKKTSSQPGDGHFSLGATFGKPGPWKAEFVQSYFIPQSTIKLGNGGTRVIMPGIAEAPGWCGHGSRFTYFAEKDAWEEYDMEARRVTGVWNRYKGERVTMGRTVVPPDSESPRDEPDEETTAPESLETRAAASAKAKAAEAAERPGFARKLSSFLFGEQEEEPTTVAEAEEAPSAEQPPPLPPRRTEPEPAAKAEEMYNRIAAWYSEPENAALRATWGAYPDPDEFQTWPGFVAVTNAFLDREAG